MMRRPVRPPSDPFGWAGAVLDGRYRIGEVVGEGGFGVVHAGQCLGTDERIAIKFLKLDGAVPFAGRARFLPHFIGEGKLLSRLGELTSGVVRAIDVGAATAPNGVWTPYVVLEWLDGVTLEEELAARREGGLGGRSLREAIELLDSAARAVEVAHEHGVVHRDLKPGNLVVTEGEGRWTLKILDFGVAKVMRDLRMRTDSGSTSPPHHAFSPPYGAPEQFEQRYGASGPWTDVFALALVLVEVVSGRRALTGEVAGELYRHAADPARRPTLRALGVESGDEVDRVLRRALAVEPRERYRRAGDFWEALIAASRTEPALAVAARSPAAETTETSDAPEMPPDEAGWEITEVAPMVVSKSAPDAEPQMVPSAVPDPVTDVAAETKVALHRTSDAAEEVADSDVTEMPNRVQTPPLKPLPPPLPPASRAPLARVVVRVNQVESDGRHTRPIVVAIALSGLAAALVASAISLWSHSNEARSISTHRSASTVPIAERQPPAVEPVAPAVTQAVAADVGDAVATAPIAATSAPAVTPTPRAHPPPPPREPPLCPNCATHPYECGKFSLPQVRGDCYCGCSASSHCALSPGRSTGPCVPNTNGVSETL